jgi:nitric oxide reductase NorD protein
MSWKMENRDGAAIRHCVEKMKSWPAQRKLLLLLSDGKPLDCGCPQYSDSYAQFDTKMALKEARQAGIQPFCITVDPYGQKYLADLYGANGYIVIERLSELPSKIPKIYHRLTT